MVQETFLELLLLGGQNEKLIKSSVSAQDLPDKCIAILPDPNGCVLTHLVQSDSIDRVTTGSISGEDIGSFCKPIIAHGVLTGTIHYFTSVTCTSGRLLAICEKD